ncbi:hypothetical protein ACJ41O_011500 [Fusarium nematophilum]
MRLLNTSSYQLTEFIGPKVPPYVILSHTWEEEEVLFQDIQDPTAASSKKGYAKVVGCCQKAASDGFEWAWIDSCCIDKASSAELSEAINSMYRWYAGSSICYVYLQDVVAAAGDAPPVELLTPGLKRQSLHSSRRSRRNLPKIFTPKDFSSSRWFKRGWTLQELIAPGNVEFYTSDWAELGTKRSLAPRILAATGIPIRILYGEDPSASCSVAERMSWASRRVTTREEDMAYCLLGLFDVNMPLLYGEGAKSFLRLQEQILRQQEDYSVFAWTLQHYHSGPFPLTGFLASSPAEYARTASEDLELPVLADRGSITAANASKFLKHHRRPGELDVKDSGMGYMAPDHFARYHTDSCPIDTYQFLHTKAYERLRRYNLGQEVSVKHGYLPRAPPELTSRGLRISLPISRPTDPTLPALAWIYCEIDDRLLCVLLQPFAAAASSSSRVLAVLGRHSSPWLVTVDKSRLPRFALTELLLQPDRHVGEEASMLSVVRSSLDSPRSDVQFVVAPSAQRGYTVRVVSTCNLISSDGTLWSGGDFDGESSDTGVLLIECARGDEASRFQIRCGTPPGGAWCCIREVLESQNTSFRRRLSTGPMARVMDRAAEVSGRLEGTVVSAAIRKSPTVEDQSSAGYTLRVSVCELGRCDGWVQLYLSERDVEIWG